MKRAAVTLVKTCSCLVFGFPEGRRLHPLCCQQETRILPKRGHGSRMKPGGGVTVYQQRRGPSLIHWLSFALGAVFLWSFMHNVLFSQLCFDNTMF